MEKEITVRQASELYAILKNAKLTKMNDLDSKFKIIQLCKSLKEPAESFQTTKEETINKLKPEGFEKYASLARQWKAEGEKTTLTDEEKSKVNEVLTKYSEEVNECVTKAGAKTIKLNVDAIANKEEVLNFASSNDFDVETTSKFCDLLL